MTPFEPEYQGIFYTGFTLSLITIIPNTVLLFLSIRRARQTTIRNQIVIVLSYLINEIALISRILLIIPSDITGALQNLIFVTTYIDLLLACFLLGELFKQILELVPSWTPGKILKLQISVISLIAVIRCGRLIPFSYTADLPNNPLAAWSVIGGAIGSIIFEIYYIWQNGLIYKSLDRFIKEKYSKLEEGAVFEKIIDSNYFALMLMRSDFQIPFFISFWSAAVGLLVIIENVVTVGLFYGNISLFRSLAISAVGPVLLNVQVTAAIYLFELLIDINIKAKIENQPSIEAKEKAKQFIEQWRKKVQSPQPSASRKETSSKRLSKSNRSNSDVESALNNPILGEDASVLIKTKLPSTYTQQKIEGLEKFKKDYPGVKQVESLKEQLKQKHAEAKRLGEEARVLKQQIKQLKALEERPKLLGYEEEREVSLEDLSEKSKPEKSNSDALDDFNSKYKRICSGIKLLMKEIECLQKDIEAGRAMINSAFETHWQQTQEELMRSAEI